MKVLALCTALGLGGGYVWQRQKAAADHENDDASKRPQEAQRTVLPGSKSAWGAPPGGKILGERGEVIEPPGISQSDLDEAMKRDSDDFGSRGFVLPDEVPDEPVRKRTVLPGSKSIDRILPPPVQEQEEEP